MQTPSDLLSYVVIGLTLFLFAGLYVSWRATRLDRLHARVEVARAALDASLVRRSATALELAASGLLDPAASLLLAGAAHDARAADDDHRELAESDLSRALRAVFQQPDFRVNLATHDGGGALVAELDAAATKVLFARRFHNDAVAATRTYRHRWLVRLLRLAGRAPTPPFFEIDDAPPDNGG